MNPSPLPSPIDVAVDPNRVTPGLLGFLALVALIVAVVLLYFSMRKQLSKIHFEEGALPAGVRPLPKYATKAERRKSAARYDAAVAASAAASGKNLGPVPEAGSGAGLGSSTAPDDPAAP